MNPLYGGLFVAVLLVLAFVSRHLGLKIIAATVGPIAANFFGLVYLVIVLTLLVLVMTRRLVW